MSLRAEKRRQQREAEKRAAKTVKNLALLTGQNEDDIRPLVTPDMVANFPAGKIASLTGTKVETLNWWIKAREKELFEYCEKETIKTAQEKLYLAENHIAFINIMISLLAIKMTWGFTKANNRWLKNLNAASDFIKRYGVKYTYDMLVKEMDIGELEFDSFDIEEELEMGEAKELWKDERIIVG